MNRDIRLSTGFWQHPKTKKTIKKLGLEGIQALQVLWLWAAINRPDGKLLGMDWEDIELTVDWQGEEKAFFNVCVGDGNSSMWIDTMQDGSFILHDWVEHNPWQADAESRSNAARFSNLAKINKPLYETLKAQGVKGLSKEAFERCKADDSSVPYSDKTSESYNKNTMMEFTPCEQGRQGLCAIEGTSLAEELSLAKIFTKTLPTREALSETDCLSAIEEISNTNIMPATEKFSAIKTLPATEEVSPTKSVSAKESISSTKSVSVKEVLPDTSITSTAEVLSDINIVSTTEEHSTTNNSSTYTIENSAMLSICTPHSANIVSEGDACVTDTTPLRHGNVPKAKRPSPSPFPFPQPKRNKNTQQTSIPTTSRAYEETKRNVCVHNTFSSSDPDKQMLIQSTSVPECASSNEHISLLTRATSRASSPNKNPLSQTREDSCAMRQKNSPITTSDFVSPQQNSSLTMASSLPCQQDSPMAMASSLPCQQDSPMVMASSLPRQQDSPMAMDSSLPCQQDSPMVMASSKKNLKTASRSSDRATVKNAQSLPYSYQKNVPLSGSQEGTLRRETSFQRKKFITTDSPSKGTPEWSNFLHCYEAYPVQKNQEGAWRAWMELSQRGILDPSAYILDKIIELKTYDSQWLAGYAPNMERWLRNKGWNDKPYIKPKTVKEQQSFFSVMPKTPEQRAQEKQKAEAFLSRKREEARRETAKILEQRRKNQTKQQQKIKPATLSLVEETEEEKKQREQRQAFLKEQFDAMISQQVSKAL